MGFTDIIKANAGISLGCALTQCDYRAQECVPSGRKPGVLFSLPHWKSLISSASFHLLVSSQQVFANEPRSSLISKK